MPGVRPVSTQGLAVHPATFVEPRTMLTRAERLLDTDSGIHIELRVHWVGPNISRPR